MEETQAIMRLRQGDLDGLEVLVCKYYDQAVRAAYGVVRDHALAEDIVQTCFIQASEKIGQFDGSRSFGPWFLRSVVNRAINASVQRKPLISLDADTTEQETSFSAEQFFASLPGPEEMVEMDEMQRIIWQALDHLTPKQRAAIILRYYLDFSEIEITHEMNIPRSSVKWWLFTARERLRSLLHSLQPKPSPTQENPGINERNK